MKSGVTLCQLIHCTTGKKSHTIESGSVTWKKCIQMPNWESVLQKKNSSLRLVSDISAPLKVITILSNQARRHVLCAWRDSQQPIAGLDHLFTTKDRENILYKLVHSQSQVSKGFFWLLLKGEAHNWHSLSLNLCIW